MRPTENIVLKINPLFTSNLPLSPKTWKTLFQFKILFIYILVIYQYFSVSTIFSFSHPKIASVIIMRKYKLKLWDKNGKIMRTGVSFYILHQASVLLKRQIQEY